MASTRACLCLGEKVCYQLARFRLVRQADGQVVMQLLRFDIDSVLPDMVKFSPWHSIGLLILGRCDKSSSLWCLGG